MLLKATDSNCINVNSVIEPPASKAVYLQSVGRIPYEN